MRVGVPAAALSLPGKLSDVTGTPVLDLHAALRLADDVVRHDRHHSELGGGDLAEHLHDNHGTHLEHHADA